jgi:CheY-like chemotaxis protein
MKCPGASPSRQTRSNYPRLILSVDNEPALLYFRWKILQREGYDVLNAACGQHALQIFAAHTADLVLLAYQMPGMNGGIVAQR